MNDPSVCSLCEWGLVTGQEGVMMKKWFILIAVAVVLSGCRSPSAVHKSSASATLTTPERVDGKYILQAFYVYVPDSVWDGDKVSRPICEQKEVEFLFNHPAVEIVKFPLVQAGIGESVINDQREIIEVPDDVDVVDGAVVKSSKSVAVGESASVEIKAVNQAGAVVTKWSLNGSWLTGADSYEVAGQQVEVPIYKSRQIEMQRFLQPSLWNITSSASAYNENGTQIHELILLRLLPPS